MKDILRKLSLEKRKTLDCEKLSEKVMNFLFSLEEYPKSKNIICYYPLKYEVNTIKCIEDKTKNIYLPRVNGENLEICPLGELKSGYCLIQEPVTPAIKDYSMFDMIIIPACAADKYGYRIGYGKGFYDRFLPLLPDTCLKVVLIYSPFLYKSIYPDKFDIKADIIISDKEILYFPDYPSVDIIVNNDNH